MKVADRIADEPYRPRYCGKLEPPTEESCLLRCLGWELLADCTERRNIRRKCFTDTSETWWNSKLAEDSWDLSN